MPTSTGNTIRVIRVPYHPARQIEVATVGRQWDAMASAIGGPCHFIERFRCPLTVEHGLVGVLDEDGQYNGQPMNQRAWPLYPIPGYSLRGDVLVVAEGYGPQGLDFVDLADPEAALVVVKNLLGVCHLRGE